MHIAKNTVVSLHYTLTDDKGEVLDSSVGGHPLVYLHGVGGIIPGLENALTNRQPGDKLKVTIDPDEAYGEHDPQQVQQVPRSAFQGVDQIEVGMQFTAQGEHGVVTVSVVDVDAETVTIDANHPLAGVRLHFDCDVVDVREASEEELAHGHAHGEGGHHH